MTAKQQQQAAQKHRELLQAANDYRRDGNAVLETLCTEKARQLREKALQDERGVK